MNELFKRIAFFLYCLSLLVGAYLFICVWAVLMWTKPARAHAETTPARCGQPYENVEFRARHDGLRLKGWFLPANGARIARRVLIILHGKDGNRNVAFPLACDMAERDFAVLAFDFRGHGESEGERYSLGYYERWDTLGAIDYMKSRGYAPRRIALVGFSMGAATALLTAPESDVAAVVSDSAYTDVRSLVHERFGKWGLPVLAPTILWLGQPLLGVNADEVAPAEAARRFAPRPILFIHGDADNSVPVSHAYRNYELNRDHAELWILNGVEHIGAFDAARSEYLARVTAFFEQAMK